MDQQGKTKRATVTRRCPICGHESWRIIYGMMMPDDMVKYEKVEFAGCIIFEEQRIYPASGYVEWGTPKWACQNQGCGHRWW
jgi:hypothetical protein